MDWWEKSYYIEQSEEEIREWKQRSCNHEWKAIILITSIVYDCVKCEMKKEHYENKK